MSESMSELEQARIKVILEYLKANSEISSLSAAKLLEVQHKTASRLLAKGEKVGVLESRGKTRSKVYLLK